MDICLECLVLFPEFLPLLFDTLEIKYAHNLPPKNKKVIYKGAIARYHLNLLLHFLNAEHD